jgi:Protein of unknown function (DUF3311)
VNGDKSPWNWLLLLPIVVPLVPILYNGTEPRLFGFPRFYWLQLAYVVLGAACTGVVFVKTRSKK